MKKFITNQLKQVLITEVIKKATVLTKEELGPFVMGLMDKYSLKNRWIAYTTDLSKEEVEFLELIKQGITIYYLDGVYYYNEANRKTEGPFASKISPYCHIISKRTINKLLEKDKIRFDVDATKEAKSHEVKFKLENETN